MKRIYDETLTKGNPQSRILVPTIAQKIAGVVAEIMGTLASWAYAHAGDARRPPRGWQ